MRAAILRADAEPISAHDVTLGRLGARSVRVRAASRACHSDLHTDNGDNTGGPQ
jgi:Zn-dependent alcohol dehydrogenase